MRGTRSQDGDSALHVERAGSGGSNCTINSENESMWDGHENAEYEMNISRRGVLKLGAAAAIASVSATAWGADPPKPGAAPLRPVLPQATGAS